VYFILVFLQARIINGLLVYPGPAGFLLISTVLQPILSVIVKRGGQGAEHCARIYLFVMQKKTTQQKISINFFIQKRFNFTKMTNKV
jgi:hypothetical protein